MLPETIKRAELMHLSEEASSFIRSQFGLIPSIAIQTGSGIALGENPEGVLAFKDIPHFPTLTVPGHAGELRYVRGDSGCYLHISGRAHYYEGLPAWRLGVPLWALSLAGVDEYVSISSCGSLDDSILVGSFALITDYINFAGINPLRGITGESGMMEFPAMRNIADPALASTAELASRAIGMQLARAVYAIVPGPAYETIAELHALKTLGAGVVGMSTVPELMVARSLGMKTCAIAAITNKPLSTYPLHLDVINAARELQPKVEKWLIEFLSERRRIWPDKK